MSTPTQQTIDAILSVLRSFSKYEGQPSGSHTAYETVVSQKIKDFHQAQQPLQLLLPAIPWKNPNTDKTLDATPFPGLGEQLGLARLNHLCAELARLHEYGAELTLVSDYPVYNDLLKIPDADCWAYTSELRSLARRCGFSHIRFVRLMDVLDMGDGEACSRETYLAASAGLRAAMEERFLGVGFDLDVHVAANPDTELTYQKYVRSAREDLCWGPELDGAVREDSARYDEETRKVARLMTARLLAYEWALESKYPRSIRLSIHRSTGKAKISVPLIPQDHTFGLMPWHSCLVVTADGRFVTRASREVRDDDAKYEVVRDEKGRPDFLRERHPDFEGWPAGVRITHAYPRTVVVVNTSEDEQGRRLLTPELKAKLAGMALRFEKLDVQGFEP